MDALAREDVVEQGEEVVGEAVPGVAGRVADPGGVAVPTRVVPQQPTPAPERAAQVEAESGVALAAGGQAVQLDDGRALALDLVGERRPGGVEGRHVVSLGRGVRTGLEYGGMRLTNVAQMALPAGRLHGYVLRTGGRPGRALPVSFDQGRHVGEGPRPGSWMAVSFRMPSAVDRADLATAWEAVVARHGTLRTAFALGPTGDVRVEEVDVLGGDWVEHPVADGVPVRDVLREVLDAACSPLERPLTDSASSRRTGSARSSSWGPTTPTSTCGRCSSSCVTCSRAWTTSRTGVRRWRMPRRWRRSATTRPCWPRCRPRHPRSHSGGPRSSGRAVEPCRCSRCPSATWRSHRRPSSRCATCSTPRRCAASRPSPTTAACG